MAREAIAVSDELATLLEMLEKRLQDQFGCDYAFTVVGNGKIVAASNYVYGHIEPTRAA